MELAIEVFLRGIATVAAVVTLTRLNGLRSFSKMSSFDFSLTVALGSIVGGTLLSPESPLILGMLAVATVFLIQAATAVARRSWSSVRGILDNQPLLVMDGDRLLPKAMDRARVTEADIWAKLREANVLSLQEVHAVVIESTGDVSVLHGRPEKGRVDLDTMLDGVQRLD